MHAFHLLFICFNIVAVQDIADKVKIDVAEYEIKNLAVHVPDSAGNRQVQVIFFKLSGDLKCMVSKLHQIYQSEIFQQIWNKKFQDALRESDNQTITLDTVLESVWKPTSQKCRDLLQVVLNGEIPLADVDKYLVPYQDRYDDLRSDLHIIAKVCDVKVVAERVAHQVDKVKRYHELKSCIKAADKILEFQEKMELNGDFTMVEEFHSQVL